MPKKGDFNLNEIFEMSDDEEKPKGKNKPSGNMEDMMAKMMERLEQLETVKATKPPKQTRQYKDEATAQRMREVLAKNREKSKEARARKAEHAKAFNTAFNNEINQSIEQQLKNKHQPQPVQQAPQPVQQAQAPAQKRNLVLGGSIRQRLFEY